MDVAKITCRQLFFDKVISPNEKSLALWLSGYYNAKRNNTVLDLGALAKNVDKVEDYCRMNRRRNGDGRGHQSARPGQLIALV